MCVPQHLIFPTEVQVFFTSSAHFTPSFLLSYKGYYLLNSV